MSSFYAVRKGKSGLRSCIFLNWEDCREWLEGNEHAEYSVCESLEAANLFIVHGENQVENKLKTNQVENKLETNPVENKVETNQVDNKLETNPVENELKTNQVDNKLETNQMDNKLETNQVENKVETNQVEDKVETNHMNNELEINQVDNKLEINQVQHIQDENDSEITVVTKEESTQEMPYDSEDKMPNEISDDKLTNETSMDFTNEIENEDQNSDATKTLFCHGMMHNSLVVGTRRGRTRGIKAFANPNRKPTKAWQMSFEDLKKYKEANLTFKIDPSDKKHADLLRWTRQQQHEYRHLKDGRPSAMFQVKIDALTGIGFFFKYHSIVERITALIKFKEEKGHYNIPTDDPILGKWVEKERHSAVKFTKGDPTAFFEHKINDLKSLGVEFSDKDTSCGNPALNLNPCEAEEEDERKWNEAFDLLVKHKDLKGTCEVKPSEHTPLSYWITKQLQEYQKIKDKKPTKLTLRRMQRLNDIGFIFRQMVKTTTWEERIEQLRKYKEQYNHTKVPKSHPELGVFVNRQRYEYGKYREGKQSTMNEQRIRDLESLDFTFEAGKRMSHVDYKNKKTWDERYDELLQFRTAYGHAVVPQSFPGLGEWVHSMRMYYKKLKQGKKSPLTAERVLKLADAGFVFDATKRRGGGNHPHNEDVNI